MKTFKQTSLFSFVFLFLWAAAYASPPRQEDVQLWVRQIQTEHKTALIQIDNLPAGQTACLKIRDQRGAVLLKEFIKQKEQYARKYDLSHLPLGTYSVELRTTQGVVKQLLSLKTGQTHPGYFLPSIQQIAAGLKLVFTNPMHAPVSVKLMDEQAKIIYEEDIDAQQPYAKTLNTSQLAAGRYSLAIRGEDYFYMKDIVIE